MPPLTPAKLKQITYWKKHQTMLKICRELSDMCGSRILVRNMSIFMQ